MLSRFGDGRGPARQNNPKLSKLTGLRIYFNRPRMLLDDDVVAQRQPETRAFTGGLGRKEWAEHLFLNFGRNTSAVVADCDFDAVAYGQAWMY